MLIIFFYGVSILLYWLFEKSVKHFVTSYVYEDNLMTILKQFNDLDFVSFQNKRYGKSSFILMLMMFLPLLKFNIYFALFCVVIALFEYKRPYILLLKQYNKQLSDIRFQFPIWLRQIQILLYNNNVLNAIEISIASAPVIMQDELNVLVEKLRVNPNDYNAFTQFMSNYNIQEIERALKLLYRAYVIEQDDATIQIGRMINSTTKWMRSERKNRQEDSLKLFEWIGIIPLFGVTVVFLIMMASLINNLFGKGATF